MKRSKFSRRLFLLILFLKALLVSSYPSSGDQSARGEAVLLSDLRYSMTEDNDICMTFRYLEL